MKALVLDGFNAAGELQAAALDAVTSGLAARGWVAEVLAPREMDLAPCNGCFGCWTKTPGRCVQADDAELLCGRIMASDLFMVVTPVTFGGYSSSAKTAIDRTIGLISPFFTVVRDEVHHRTRYDRYPALAALGVNHGNCPECPEVFKTLLYRHAVDLHAPSMAVAVAAEEDAAAGRLGPVVAGLLDRLDSGELSDLPVVKVSKEQFAGDADAPPAHWTGGQGRKAVVLVGSPKVRSTSASLGDGLAAGLAARGWEVQTLRVLPAVMRPEKWAALKEAVNGADLVALAAPLYVDSLPAPVTRALEALAEARTGEPEARPAGFAAVVNNGFPESFHSHTALAIARRFAEEAGYRWMGGLALGMGGFIDGRPLGDCGRTVRNVIRALDLTAAAFHRGEPVPPEAVDLMARPFVPRWLYLGVGNWGWKRQARKNGIRGRIDARPFAPERGSGKPQG